MSSWLGSSWEAIGWVALGTALMYLSALISIRIAGRRTVTRLSAFDFIVTIAIGSLIASTVVAQEPAYAQGLVALMTLLAMQTIVGFLRQKSEAIRKLADFRPVMLFSEGSFDLPSAPWTAQLTRTEVEAALRERGVFSTDNVDMVILEPSGEISILEKGAEAPRNLMAGGVKNAEAAREDNPRGGRSDDN